MKDRIIQEAIRFAQQRAGPISVALYGAVKPFGQKSILDATALETNLIAAGFSVVYDDKNNGSWAYITRPNPKFVLHPDGIKEGKKLVVFEPTIIVGQGYSQDRDSALFHAAFGAAREEYGTKIVGEELAKRKLKVDDKLRQQLESRFLLEGGFSRLNADLDSFPKKA